MTKKRKIRDNSEDEEVLKYSFNTKNVEEITEQINEGVIIKRYQNPWFKNEVGVRRAGLVFQLEEDELNEYIRCASDIFYFAEKYCKIKTEDGSIDNIKLRDYQRDILELFKKRRVILAASRQIGKTINAAITILHYITFSTDKNVMIVANMRDTTIEIMDKIKDIYRNLPFFLKVGIKNWNMKSFVCDTGCRIKTAAKSKTPAIGFSIDFLYLDEFAHIPANVIEPYYRAVYPTITAQNNSRLIITSTPCGMNLFHKLLINSEKPKDDPTYNNFDSRRIYWYQVEGRFVTYFRLKPQVLFELGINKDDIFGKVKQAYPHAKIDMMFIRDLEKDVIFIYNSDTCIDEDVKKFKYTHNEVEYSIQHLAYVTTWKEEATKEIGGEASFEQEYNIKFTDGSRSLLNEAVIDNLLKNQKYYVHKNYVEFDRRLKFNYDGLEFVDDVNLFTYENRKNIKGIISIDIASGLGGDYSIINIFKISPKSSNIIDIQKNTYTSLLDFFCLEQIGIYRSNLTSVKQLAELFSVLTFEFFNPENFKVVVEFNHCGSEFINSLPHLFDGDVEYGSYVFYKYKHQEEAEDEKIGLRLNTKNKELMVKNYQDNMNMKNFIITNPININEITTFVKHDTPAGNVIYKADNGNDDCVLKGTLIKTINGYVNIEDIELGDLVLTHLGNYKKVTNICIKDFCGDMYTFLFDGQLSLSLTYNHPLYTNKGWVLPSNITDKHKSISIKDNFKEIDLDDKFAIFLGLFLRGGDLCDGVISIGLHKSYTEYNLWLKKYLNKLDIRYHQRFNNKYKLYKIIFEDDGMYNVLKNCYSNNTKVINNLVYELGSNIKYTLESWMNTDYVFYNLNDDNSNYTMCSTTNKQIALSMMDIANSIHKHTTIFKSEKSYILKIYNKIDNSKNIIESDLKNVQKNIYKGVVYNLEVEDDNSYIANGIVVHNCVMTIVNATTVFKKPQFKSMVEEYAHEILDMNTINTYNNILKDQEYKNTPVGVDYSEMIEVKNKQMMMNKYKNHPNKSWY